MMLTPVMIMILLAALLGSACMVGFMSWTFFRLRGPERRDAVSGALEAITEQLDALRDQLEGVHGEVARLKEQADFTERLLTARGESGSGHPERDDSP
ncbi:MAG: hypothetical protein ACE5HQ_13345 [Gemmatimonadota bacterium]